MAFRVFRFAVINIKPRTGVLNNVMFIGEPYGSNRSRVSNRSRGGGSDTIVLIEARGFY